MLLGSEATNEGVVCVLLPGMRGRKEREKERGGKGGREEEESERPGMVMGRYGVVESSPSMDLTGISSRECVTTAEPI